MNDTGIDYTSLVQGMPRTGVATKPMTVGRRGMNTALHGAGSAITEQRHSEPALPKRDYAPQNTSPAQALELSFAKLPSGGWGIRAYGPGADSVTGTVTVEKRDGSTTDVTVGAKVSSGRATIYEIARKPESAVPRPTPQEERFQAGPKAPTETAKVPNGNYAVAVDGDKNDLSFFRVNSPDEGKWAGFLFLDQYASDERYPVKGARKAKVLALIAADVDGAGTLYGQTLGKCRECNRALTDEQSRAAGIGPDCAAKGS